MNLFQLAAQNDPDLQVRYEAIKSHCEDSGVLDVFADWVRASGRIAINMRPSVLAELVNGRRHQNIYEWAEEQSGLSSRPSDEILREKLGPFYRRRIHFDDAFEGGRRFRYASLNVGGTGLHRYGQFCAVLNSDFAQPENSFAYLMGDSLHSYMPTDVDVDTARLRRELSTPSHVPYLAALKHSAEIPKLLPQEWARMVCRDECYIEGIFVQDLELSSVDQVRIAQPEYDRMFDLAFTEYTQPHDDTTHSLKADFVCILRASRDGCFVLERI